LHTGPQSVIDDRLWVCAIVKSRLNQRFDLIEAACDDTIRYLLQRIAH
jgi:hypothetical protein